MKSASLIELLEAALSIDLKQVFAEKDKELANMLKRIDLLKAAGEAVKVNLDSILRDAPAPAGRLDPKTEKLRKLYSQIEYALKVAYNAESDMKEVNACIKTKVDDTEGVFLNLFKAVKQAIQIPEQHSYRGSPTPPPLPKHEDTQTYELVPISYKADTYHIPKEEAEAYAVLKKYTAEIKIVNNHIYSVSFFWVKLKKIPEELGKLSHLKKLDLQHIDMTDLSNLPNVELNYLNLSNNDFFNVNGLEIYQQLSELDLSSCTSRLKDISSLEKMAGLKHVRFTNACIDYDNPAIVKTIQSLIKRGVEVQR